MVSGIGFKSYIIFAAINLAAIPMVYFFFPETSCLPLEAIDLLFSPDENGKQPGIFTVVRNSTNKNFVSTIEVQMDENAALEAKIIEIEKVEKV